MKQEQIIKALKCCANDGACSSCPLREDYTPCLTTMARDALSLIRKLEREKEEIVHKTLARVKIKCQRVAYSDMAVPGVMHEIFTIKGEDLDEIEKELSQRC